MKPLFSERMFGWLLRLLPHGFVEEYGADMTATFARRAAAARGCGRLRFGWFLVREFSGLIRVVVKERAAALRAWPSLSRIRTRRGRENATGTRISWLDVKIGLRMLVKHPALTLIGGLGLAVGMAISVGFYSFIAAHAYPTLPLDEGERIVALENRDMAVNNEERRSLHDFFTWREELESVEDLAAFRTVEHNLIPDDAPPELVQLAEMTASGFRLARVPPLLGRYLVDDDEREGGPPVVVIGYHVWRNTFGGDSAVVGRGVRLGGVVHTVVGVMPEGFAFPENHRFWTPLRERPSAYERREGPAIFIAGRLAPGVTTEMAQSELSAIGLRTAAAYPETHELLRPMVMPYTHSLMDIQGMSLWRVIQTNLMVSLVLIVVALNVAVLVYARTAARHREIAVRNALGASRGRIVAQLFVEALVLSVVASACGLALARFGVGMGNRILEMGQETGVPFWTDDSLRPGTIFFTLGVAVLVAVITGVLPALQATGRRLQSGLRQLDGASMRLGRTWTAMIVVQIAIAVATLPAAVNMAWDSMLGALMQPTFPAEEIAAAVLVPEAPDDATARAGAGLNLLRQNQTTVHYGDRLAELLRRLEAEAAVAGATFVAIQPRREAIIRVEGVPAPPEYPAGHRVGSRGVHPGFMEVAGLRLLRGRSFEGSDLGEDASAVIVSRGFVQQVLGGGEALGRRIRFVSEEEREGSGQAGPVRWHEIVGVTEDAFTNPAAPEQNAAGVDYPVAPTEVQRAAVMVRLRGSTPAEFATRFREITAEVDPTLRLTPIRSGADSFRQERIAARLIGLAVGLVLLSALLLSAAGIYAMMSFTVTQRRREIGIHSALGAQPGQVVRSIFSRAAAQIALGLTVGVATAGVIERVTGGGLVGGRGAVLLPALALIIAAVGVLAALGPARRALKIQPTEALRADG